MPSSQSVSPESAGDDFFNDLSRQGSGTASGERPPSPKRTNTRNNSNEGGDDLVPRTKRIACIVCRKRKLKCDGTKPRCGTCERLGHSCAYDEVRKKSGPKRGYVKHLEARLAQVETLLKTQDPVDLAEPINVMPNIPSTSFADVQGVALNGDPPDYMLPLGANHGLTDPQLGGIVNTLAMVPEEEFSWELISLGLEEPLPSQEFINEMHQIYFEKVHPSAPIIHRLRYFAAMDLAPSMRPAVCLRYAMWTHVCSITRKYAALTGIFYARARKYAELDELKGFGESMITIAHCQCWSLIATFEFKMMYFPRAWMSVGRATRLSQLMSLHRQDGPALDVKQALPPPRDWTEREERRRTFWIAFCQDRYASIGTGWPMTIDERDVSTNLPATEEAFLKSIPERTLPLAAVMTADGASTLSPFGGVALMACLFGRNLTHLHRTDDDNNDHDIDGSFWRRHHNLDNILLNTSLSLPEQLRLPAGINDSSIIFVNMNIHAATICLHQAAIYKADKNHMSPNIGGESKRRCIIAADQIANIMKLVSHIDLSTMNPFIAFCLYVAARVFVQYLKAHKSDMAITSSLKFLLSAMQALKAKNPLTESFLVQLDVDLEGSGLRLSASIPLGATSGWGSRAANDVDQAVCKSIFDMRLADERVKATAFKSDAPAAMPTTSGNLMDFSREPKGQRQENLCVISNPNQASEGIREPDSMFHPPLSAYEETSGIMDIDQSFENSSSQRFPSQPNSGHPTPSTSSYNASSQNSFSPPHADDQPNLTNSSSAARLSPNTAASFPNGTSNTSYGVNLSSASGVHSAEGVANSFTMPSSWDHASFRQSPGPAPAGFDVNGMTTGEVPAWQPVGVVEGNEWLYANWNEVNTSR